MGLKKYEIITVGSDKRVRALRSWRVQDRYVNIGDVGGIVYDEKTLSQDGACWLFRGNFGFPGARIGGDSVVDVGEAALSDTGAPNVDILGSSVVVGNKLQFVSDQTAADAVVLTAADFEQGGFGYSSPIGTNWENWKVISPNYVRTVKPIFAGGNPVTLKLDVPGYKLNWFALDRDGNVIAYGSDIISGAGITTVVPACHSFVFRLAKDPIAAIVPADATAAKIKFTGTYETKLVVVDSRLEVGPVNSTRVVTVRPGGTYTITSGAKYPDSVIRNSKVVINGHATANRTVRLMSEFIGCNVAIDATRDNAQSVGIYSNVNNLTFTGAVSSNSTNVAVHSSIQATDCDNFAVSPAIFLGITAAQSANMPFIFQGCNVPNGRFYHHAQIANTYKNIDFAKASVDLGKTLVGSREFASSEVEGMYRLVTPASGLVGCLVESSASVEKLIFGNFATAYNTTIYKDAYVSGKFDFAGTNVFGNTKKHDTQEVSGCKIVNTGETAVNMKGNIRVEGNATLTNCSIIGSGYFGGKAVASGLLIEGSVFMSDNASFTKTAGVSVIRNLKMTENAYAVLGDFALNGRIHLSDNAGFTPTAAGISGGDLVMKDNAVISGAVAVDGVITMKDDAKVSAGTLSAYGDITLCGSYNQTISKTWTGKRVISSQDAPTYDDNVKTKYDF